MTNPAPKYSLAEIERRWLVDLSHVGPFDELASRVIDDLYIDGTRLRLRKMASADSVVYKLCKKYGKQASAVERITNIYLTEEEYLLLSTLPGKRIRKCRYSIAGGSLDIFEGPKSAPAIFGIEFADERQARDYLPPGFATQEVTDDVAYSGAALAFR